MFLHTLNAIDPPPRQTWPSRCCNRPKALKRQFVPELPTGGVLPHMRETGRPIAEMAAWVRHVMHALCTAVPYSRLSWTWPMMPWPARRGAGPGDAAVHGPTHGPALAVGGGDGDWGVQSLEASKGEAKEIAGVIVAMVASAGIPSPRAPWVVDRLWPQAAGWNRTSWRCPAWHCSTSCMTPLSCAASRAPSPPLRPIGAVSWTCPRVG